MKGQRRKGIKVHRGKLYMHYVRALALLQPRAFVFENVPGLASANKGLAYETIKQDLQDPAEALREGTREDPASFADAAATAIGEPYVLLFADNVDLIKLGVPQTRRRLIIVGIRRDVAAGMSAFDLAVAKMQFRELMNGGRSKFGTFPLTCLEVFEGRPLSELQHEYREAMEQWLPLIDEMPRRDRADAWRREVKERLTFDVKKDYLLRCGLEPHVIEMFDGDFDEAMEEHAHVLQELGFYRRPVADLDPTDGSNRIANETRAVRGRMHMIPPGNNYEFVDGTEWQVAGNGLSPTYRRPFPLEPAPTVLAFGGGGSYAYHYDRSRSMLTSRERARIQTFSDDFLFSGDAAQVRAQIGEAVPPLLAWRIAEELRRVLA
jgi:DNA (cytosine-5)-methyltransferase 1